MTFGALVSLAVGAVRNPREVANTLLSIGFPSSALLPSLVLVVVLSVLLSLIGELFGLQAPEGFVLPPLAWAVLLCIGLGAYVLAIYKGGRILGGTGSLAETTLLTVFWQFIMLLAQVLQLLLWVVAPPLAGLFFLAVLLIAFWIEINFIDVLHSYGSLLKSAALLILVMVALAILLVPLVPLTAPAPSAPV